MRSAAALAAVAALSAAGLSCGVAPSSPRASPSMGAAGAPSPRPAPIDDSPVLVPQRRFGSERLIVPPSARIMVSEAREAWTVVDVETGVVRGSLAGTSNRFSAASPDGRFFAFVGYGEHYPVHVWDLTTDKLRIPGLGLIAPKIEFAATGPYFTARDEKRTLIVDASTGAASEPPLPAGFTASKVSLGDRGDGLVEAANAEGSGGIFWITSGVARRFELPEYMWGYTVRGDTVLVYGSTGASLFDLATATPRTKGDPCGDTAVTAAWFAGADRFVFQCQPPIDGPSFVVADAKLERLREIANDPLREYLEVEVGSSRATMSRRDAFDTFDLATGARVTRTRGNAESSMAGGLRYIDGSGDVRSMEDGHLLASRRPNAFEGVTEATGALLRVGDLAMDTRTRALVRASGASPDGGSAFTLATEGPRASVTVTNRTSGASWTSDVAPHASVSLSPKGDFAVSHLDDLFVHTAKEKRRLGPTTDFTMNETSIAALVYEDLGAGRCRSTEGCRDVRIDDVATGASRRLGAPGALTVEFSPKGDRLLVNRVAAWDTSTSKVVWMIDPSERVAAWTTGTDLAVVIDDAPLESPGNARFLDATTGAEKRKIPGIATILGTSGRFVLLGARGRTLLLDTDGFATTEVFVDPLGGFVVSDDGRFIWFEEGGYVVAYRVADGRELKWLVDLPPFTDELVFDPADADKVPLMVRSGSNVVASPMAPAASVADSFGHPRLVDDFFAGKSVSPRRP